MYRCIYISRNLYICMCIYTRYSVYLIRGNSNYHKRSILQADVFTDQVIPGTVIRRTEASQEEAEVSCISRFAWGLGLTNWTITNMFKCLKCKNPHLWIPSMDGYGLWIRESEFHPKTAEHKVQDSSRLGTCMNLLVKQRIAELIERTWTSQWDTLRKFRQCMVTGAIWKKDWTIIKQMAKQNLKIEIII